MTPDADHYVSYTTRRGSTVVLNNLTEEQAREAAANLTPDAPPAPPETAGQTRTCGQCGGAGGWNEQRTQKTAGGGTVVVTVWVNCRPCGGSGQVPK